MTYPPTGLVVIVLADIGDGDLYLYPAYWDGIGAWFQGVDDDENDAEIVGTILGWAAKP